jgi:RNA polymerase sigma-54 factor
MKPTLSLRMSQQLTMTPQLQQAIKLLQLSTLDLQQEIQSALESNPMLELEDDQEDMSQGDTQHQDGISTGQDDYTAGEKPTDFSEPDLYTNTDNGSDEISDAPSETIPDDLGVDSSWDDVYQHATNGTAPNNGGDDDGYFDNQNATTDSLQSHLLWQLNLTPMSDRDHAIALSIIDATNSDGYISDDWNELFSGLEQDLSTAEDPLELDEAEAVLHRLQQFDPVGCCARDLSDCLLAQLRQLPENTPLIKEAMNVVTHYLQFLGNRDYATLMRRARLKEPQLKAIIALVQTLTPKPGAIIADSPPEYVIPDVLVSKDPKTGRWLVELNPEIAPKIRIHSAYAGMVKRADNSADNTFLRDNLQEARWFIKSLQSRNETLLKVATRIVEHQKAFFENGPEAMQPLVLNVIAEAVEMHESTISRVTTQKYMHTPQGIFELKYFFSSHVNTISGGECSSVAIRSIIKKMVAEENTKKPLSDSRIAQLLEDMGVQIARRTIAKYREALNIPPSNERKQLV